jgi:hypothetical protein
MAGPYEYLVFAHVMGFALWLAGAVAASLTGRAAFDMAVPLEARAICLQLRHAGLVLSRTGLAILLPVSLSLIAVGGIYGAIPTLLIWFAWAIGLAWLILIWVPRFVPIPLSGEQFLWAEVGFTGIGAIIFLGIGIPSVFGMGPLSAEWPGLKALMGGLAYGIAGTMTWFLIPKERTLSQTGQTRKTAIMLGASACVLYCLMLLAAWFGNAKPEL